METFDFYFGLKLGKLLYSHTDKLSQTLQSEKMSAVSSKRLAMLTVETISNLRNSGSFDALYDLCVRYRFDQTSLLVFENLESLLIKTLKGEETSVEMKIAREKYATDVNMTDLNVELATFKVSTKDKQIEHFHDLLKEMRLLKNPEKKFLVNVCKICRILAVNAASSATAERTFSLVRRVKNWMRSTMLPTRFNSVSILNFHKDRTDKLDLIKIANAFVQPDDNRMRIFGKFTKDDL